MIKTFILMIFLHIVDDYVLQGILAKLKQRSWWEENTSNKLYKNDYIMGLVMHSISWSFMINLPFFIDTRYEISYLVSFILNAIIHGIVDDIKANKYKINLIVDQSIHIIQILVTVIIMSIIK